MSGKARPSDWYNAVMAFNSSYQPSKPIQTQNPAARDPPITWEEYLNFFVSESAQDLILESYVFVHAFTKNNLDNFHPTLNFQALWSERAREELRKIREASARGRDAAVQFRNQRSLESMVK